MSLDVISRIVSDENEDVGEIRISKEGEAFFPLILSRKVTRLGRIDTPRGDRQTDQLHVNRGYTTHHSGASINGSSFQIASPSSIFSVATNPFPFSLPKYFTAIFALYLLTSKPSIIFEDGYSVPVPALPF